MAKVSIITASYNYENYIKETIESVIAQTFKDWEMIVVDDGSKDNSVEVIKSYAAKDERVKLFQHENGVNKGLAETLKAGISHASGEWVAFVESDDTLKPDYLEKKLAVAEKNPEVGLIFNALDMFGEPEVIDNYGKYFSQQQTILQKQNFPCRLLKSFQKEKINLIPTFSVVMVRRELMLGLDYNCPIRPYLDKFLWWQLASEVMMYYCPEKLSNWRMHKSSYVNSTGYDRENIFAMKFKRNQFLFNDCRFRKIMLYWKYYRQNIFRIKLKERFICLFGIHIKW